MSRVRIFHDWEFIDDGVRIAPVSVGMVKESGEEYYAIFNDFDPRKASPWVIKYVLGPIETPAKLPRKSRAQIKQDVLSFVGQDKPEWWGYYSAYGHVCLAQLFGSMVAFPENWPYLTLDIKQLALALGNPTLPGYPDEHHALADARGIAMRYKFLTNYAQIHGAQKDYSAAK